MYLFVSIFLLLSAMGLFTELYMIQAMNALSNQKTVAEIMHVWHLGAYSMAKENGINPATVSLCSLRQDGVSGVTGTLCQRAQDTQIIYLSPTPCPACSRAYLPTDFSTALRFNTVVYTSGGVKYIATYVADGDAGALGYKQGEILRQMKNAKIPYISYGEVKNENCNGLTQYWFVTQQYVGVGGNRICYPVPPNVTKGVGFVTVL